MRKADGDNLREGTVMILIKRCYQERRGRQKKEKMRTVGGGKKKYSLVSFNYIK